MKNLKKYFNNIAPILIGAITLDGYRRTVINDLNIKETDKLVQDTVRKSIEIANKLNDTLEQKLNEDVEIQANLGKVKESIESIEHNAKILNNLSQNNENNQTLINESSKTLKESASKANELIDKLLDIINNNSGNNNYMQNIFENINNFLNSLTSIQLGAVGHIFACISILYCLWNIFTIYYGDKLIIYFNLETKWPKLVKFIQLRRKFEYFHIKLNIFIIFIIVLYVLFINISVLSYTL
jgi:hypothetical protein